MTTIGNVCFASKSHKHEKAILFTTDDPFIRVEKPDGTIILVEICTHCGCSYAMIFERKEP